MATHASCVERIDATGKFTNSFKRSMGRIANFTLCQRGGALLL